VSDEIPLPKTGSLYAFFKKPGVRTWSANIVLPGGHTEVYDTSKTDKNQAMGEINARCRKLYKQLGMESARAYKIRTGTTLDIATVRRAMLNGEVNLLPQRFPERFPGGGMTVPMPRKPYVNGAQTALAITPEIDGAPPLVESADEGWAENVAKVEDKFAKAFHRIQALLLLGGAEDPFTLRDHVRAIVVEATLGVAATQAKKPRIPYGTGPRAAGKVPGRKPGRPPGS
jgi:hypothetical protein